MAMRNNFWNKILIVHIIESIFPFDYFPGLPAVIVGVSGAIARQTYAQEDL